MDDAAQNLEVVTDHLLHLAELQAKAAERISGSNTLVSTVPDNVTKTHGVACFLTIRALEAATTARLNGGRTMRKVSMELDAKLHGASENYSNADYMARKNLGNECRT